jgi:hypothetical protein
VSATIDQPVRDASVTHLAEDVQDAKEAILEVLNRHPDQVWRGNDLLAEATGDRRASVMGIALWNLIDSGEITLGGRRLLTLSRVPAAA